jgi:Arc/MetJ family transcription regulator
MKITLNVNDALLARVMEALGVKNKTHAIDLALREVDRKHTLERLAREGMGMSEGELKEMFDPRYDLMASRLAEGAGVYGRKDRSH